jgi:gluconolactonase
MNPFFKTYHSSAHAILGPKPTLRLLLEDPKCPFAHEAGVYIAEDDCLFITSNQFPHPDTGDTHIRISRVQLSRNRGEQPQCTEVHANGISLPNGGVNYKDGVIFCAQGTMRTGGGIAYMPLHTRHSGVKGHNSLLYEGEFLVDSFHGRSFNSPNDVVTHSDGSIWFTDPIYGFEQGIRPRPRLPNQVYRFEPQTCSIRVVADGLGRPNGICFSPDEKTCYITDTDWIHGDGSTDDTRASCM